MRRLLISAAHKSSGKTTVTLGLCAALVARGLSVQPFKKGPDYIDPMWLTMAANRPCYNLDFQCMTHAEILSMLGKSAECDISLIEGNKGLYDGLDLDGSNSNAALAKLTRTPVLLVLDARGMTRGIAPLILGYQAFDPETEIKGVILNQLGGSRHEAKLRAVIEHYTDVRVLGGIHRQSNLEIEERHLGLIPSSESTAASKYIARIRDAITNQVDLDALLVTAESPSFEFDAVPVARSSDEKKRIGILRDASFGFYYTDDLDAFETAGAELMFVDSINDHTLPELDGLFIGGGFPETRMEELESNTALRESIHNAIINGLPTYAECGGLMYLSRSITWNDKTCQMAGVIPGDIRMHKHPQGRGYVKLRETDALPWPGESNPEGFSAHEFHYSSLDNITEPLTYAYEVARGTGVTGSHDGIVMHNLVACYSHLRNTDQYPWVTRFMHFVREKS